MIASQMSEDIKSCWPGYHYEDRFDLFSNAIVNNFNQKRGELFNTTFPVNLSEYKLFDIFLSHIPENSRYYYKCNTCRDFVNSYGNLVFISENGENIPAIWPLPERVPPIFQAAVQVCGDLVRDSKIVGVFYTDKETLGFPHTGAWTHMFVNVPSSIRHKQPINTPYQSMAEKKQDFQMLTRSLSEFSLDITREAVRVLKSDVLFRSEKCLGVAEWFLGVHQSIQNIQNSKIRNNIIWKYVAKAPAGFCHIRSSMIGTLLDDILSGLRFEVISKKFKEKMHPLKYQTPQTLPSQGTVLQAEALVEKMGLQNSFKRRFAHIGDLRLLWRPKGVCEPNPKIKMGLFGSLPTRDNSRRNKIHQVDLPPVLITWVKFRDTVLGDAEKIEFFVPTQRYSYMALTTALDYNAPPILQWDYPENRNPVAWYTYHKGSHASMWNLETNKFCNVTGITLQPHMYSSEQGNFPKGVIFLLENAYDKNPDISLALFPEMLKNELHGVRSVIHTFSKRNKLERIQYPACGVAFHEGVINLKVRVHSGESYLDYILDRWD